MSKPQGADPLKILEALPKEPSAEKRRRVLGEIAEAFRERSGATARQVQELGEALSALMGKLGVGDRAYLAARLAGLEKTPTYLARSLAHDAPEVAAPILAASPVLTEEDLAQAIEKGGRERLVAVAGRPGLSASLQALIAASGEVAAIDAMLGNPSITLASELFSRLLTLARTDEKIAGHLAARPEVSLATAAELFFSLESGERRHLVQALGETAGANAMSDRAASSEPEAEAALIKAARASDTSAITQALTKRWRLSEPIAARILKEPTGEALAVLCIGLGISRAVYSSLVVLMRPEAGDGSNRSNELLGLYEHFPPAGARRIAQGWRDSGWRKPQGALASPAPRRALPPPNASADDAPEPPKSAKSAPPSRQPSARKPGPDDAPPSSPGVSLGGKKTSGL